MFCNGLLPGSHHARLWLPSRAGSDPNVRLFSPSSVAKPVNYRVGPAKIRAVAATMAEATKEASFYELLGIPISGSVPQIKRAYKKLALTYHPDVSPPGRVEEYTQRFIRVQEAYETLSDPVRKAVYDREMARGLHLAFSAAKRRNSDEGMEERNECKFRWESQLSELKRRSRCKDSGEGNMSWAARMRRQTNESFKTSS